MELVLRRVPVDRLHHARAREQHRAVILRGLGKRNARRPEPISFRALTSVPLLLATQLHP